MMKKVIYILILLLLPAVGFALDESPKGKITGYYTGWGGDAVRVQIEGASYAEEGCPVQDGYMTMESDNTGYKTHITALLAAYTSGKPVKIIVEGCIGSRPRIWGVSID